MQAIDLLVFIDVQPGKRQAQLDAFGCLAPLVLAEPGCLRYELLADAEDEHKFVIVERWASEAALTAHESSAHMLAADAGNAAFRAKPATVLKLHCVR